VSTTSTASSSRRKLGVDHPVPAVPERPEDVEATLQRLGVVPARSRGQSFLTDPFVADAEAALTQWAPGQSVLEIGGGLGQLTAALVRRGVEPLTVVEKDPRLAAHLRATFGTRIRVVEGDALELPLPAVDCVIGNLPYSVASPILVRLFEHRVPRIVFLVQREVAERLAAAPDSKAYGRPSILARLYGTVELFRTVPADAFHPKPEVESRIAVHTARPGELPVPSVPELEAVVRILFSARRKQLGNLLPRLFDSRDRAVEAAAEAGWPSDWARRRPENLAPEAYFALARVHARSRGRRAAE